MLLQVLVYPHFVVGGFSSPFLIDLLESVCSTSPKKINGVVLTKWEGRREVFMFLCC